MKPLAQSPAAATTPAAAGRTPPPAPNATPHGDAARGEGDLRQFTIAIPPRTVLLNANDRYPHWGKKYRIGQNLKDIAHQLAVIQRIPRLERATITGFVHPPDLHRRDPHNWSDTYKACVDGIVAAGVLRDDSSEFLVGSDMLPGEKARYLSFSLLIREAK